MIRQSYLEAVEDSQIETRSREGEALRRTISLMQEADRHPFDAGKRTQAIFEVNRLWSALLEDLSSNENSLPAELRAQIISIGIFILRQCEAMRESRTLNFGALIEISRNIERGLK